MKKIRFFLPFLLVWNAFPLTGQTTYFPGPVGIGTRSPVHRLDIVAPAFKGIENILRLKVSDAPNDYLELGNSTGTNSQYIASLKGLHSSSDRPGLFVLAEILSTNDKGTWGVMTFDARASGSLVVNRNAFVWRNYTSNLMVLGPTGNLGIGTLTPSHKLEVNGSVRAKEIKLEATNWPDYVFENGYDLMSLEEVKSHIDQNGHLPGLKPAKEYEAEGINMLELNQKLLEKIEELTLYVIQQQQESTSQMELIKSLQERIEVLEGVLGSPSN